MMILQSGGPAFRATFETMAQTSAGVILFHCTAGKCFCCRLGRWRGD